LLRFAVDRRSTQGVTARADPRSTAKRVLIGCAQEKGRAHFFLMRSGGLGLKINRLMAKRAAQNMKNSEKMTIHSWKEPWPMNSYHSPPTTVLMRRQYQRSKAIRAKIAKMQMMPGVSQRNQSRPVFSMVFLVEARVRVTVL